MFLKIFLLVTFSALVSCGVAPLNTQDSSWERPRRSALSGHRPHRLLDNSEHFKRHFYKKLEEDSDESGEGGNDLDEIKIFPSSRRVQVYDDQTASSVITIASTPNPISKSHSEIKQSDSKRRVFVQPHTSSIDSNFVDKQDNFGGLGSAVNVGKVHSYISAPHPSPVEHEEEHHGPAKYEFKYSVHDLEHYDVKSHQEARDGEHTVGEYSVLQPDGTILTVKYTVHGDEGFNAIVSKSELPNDELRSHYKV